MRSIHCDKCQGVIKGEAFVKAIGYGPSKDICLECWNKFISISE